MSCPEIPMKTGVICKVRNVCLTFFFTIEKLTRLFICKFKKKDIDMKWKVILI